MGTIAEIEGITAASIASVDGSDIGDIASIEGQDVPSGAALALFDIVISSGKTKSFQMVLPSGKTISVDWDDGGGSDEYNGTGSAQTVSNTYSGSGTYNCEISGDIDAITQLHTFNSPITEFGGDLVDFLGNMSALTYFTTGYGTGFSGGFDGLPSTLGYIDIQATSTLTGDLADFDGFTFTNFDFSECHNITISTSNMADCSGSVYVFSDGITAANMDKVIIGMDNAGCASGGYLWGKNGRTSASDTEAASLVTKGWTLDLGS